MVYGSPCDRALPDKVCAVVSCAALVASHLYCRTSKYLRMCLGPTLAENFVSRAVVIGEHFIVSWIPQIFLDIYEVCIKDTEAVCHSR